MPWVNNKPSFKDIIAETDEKVIIININVNSIYIQCELGKLKYLTLRQASKSYYKPHT